MERLNRLALAGGLGLILSASGCRSPRSEVPLGRPLAKDPSGAPPVQFSAEPPGPSGAAPAPGAVAPGGSLGSFGATGPSAAEATTPSPAPPTAAAPSPTPTPTPGPAHVPVPSRPAFPPGTGTGGGADGLPEGLPGLSNPN